MWICPYCGHTMTEEVARFKGCCGEVHCIDIGDKEMTDDEMDEYMERIFNPSKLPKETSNA